MITFQDVLKKRLLNNTLWSEERVYQPAKEIQLLKTEEFNNIFFDTVVSIWKNHNLLSGKIFRIKEN